MGKVSVTTQDLATSEYTAWTVITPWRRIPHSTRRSDVSTYICTRWRATSLTAKCKNAERDDNHKIPAPNRDGAEHQEGRSRRNGNVAHQLIEDIERLAVQLRSRIEGDVT